MGRNAKIPVPKELEEKVPEKIAQDTTEIMKNINNAYEIINQTFEG